VAELNERLVSRLPGDQNSLSWEDNGAKGSSPWLPQMEGDGNDWDKGLMFQVCRDDDEQSCEPSSQLAKTSCRRPISRSAETCQCRPSSRSAETGQCQPSPRSTDDQQPTSSSLGV